MREPETTMEHVILGRTGLRVPRVAVGTATFGLQCDEDQSVRILDHAAELGMTWLDTSTSYPLGSGPSSVGVTESILGRWLPGKRERCIVATKVYNRTGPADWQLGLSRKHIVSAVEGSLRRLGTDHVDLLQLHRFDKATPLEETLRALDDLVRAGKVRYVGCCNFLAHQLVSALWAADRHGLPMLRTAQVRYNLLMRGAEVEVLPACRDAGVAVLAFNVLAGGLLTGKHTRKRLPEGDNRFTFGESGQRYVRRYWTDENFSTIEQLAALAREAGVPLATLATAWVLSRPGVTVPLVGASRPEHLDTVQQALDTTLDPDLLARVDEVTRHHRAFVEELEFESS